MLKISLTAAHSISCLPVITNESLHIYCKQHAVRRRWEPTLNLTKSIKRKIRKNCWTDYHKTWWKDVVWVREETHWILVQIQIRGLMLFFSYCWKLWDKAFFHSFTDFQRNLDENKSAIFRSDILVSWKRCVQKDCMLNSDLLQLILFSYLKVLKCFYSRRSLLRY